MSDKVKINWDAESAPTVDDDSSEGYSVFSRWVNIADDELYWCMDNTEGAAVWKRLLEPLHAVSRNTCGIEHHRAHIF